jgi:uncharacterized protein YaaN involved in tellurite resistance
VVKEPTPPRRITEDEKRGLQERSLAIAAQLEKATAGEQLQLADSVSNLGLKAQRSAGRDLNLLRGRVGETLRNEGAGKQIAQDLVRLRDALNEINPNSFQKGPFGRVIGALPFVGNRALRALETIRIRYEPVSRQVEVIEESLHNGETMLKQDNAELAVLYKDVDGQQAVIQRNAYFGELMMQSLNSLMDRTEEPQAKDRIRNVLYDVSIRVQDLRTMEAVHEQFFVSIEMTRQNNNRLAQSVERTLALAMNVVLVGLAIQIALARQKDVLEAVTGTQEFIGNLIVANAAAVRKQTEEIGDIYKRPVVALDKIQQAQNDLLAAMDTVDRLKAEAIEAASENITKLSQMSEEMWQRSHGLRDLAPVDRSIEA